MKEMNEVAAGKLKPSRTFQVDADSVKVLRAKSASANLNVAADWPDMCDFGLPFNATGNTC